MDKLEDRIRRLPDDLRKEVEDFLAYLVNKHQSGNIGDSTRLFHWEREKAFLLKRQQLGPLTGQRSWRREDLYE
jgi:hypothetical protein